jgi:RNA polymerase sigma factor (sigma-70 family)
MTREEQRLVTDNLGFAVGYVSRYQSLCNETVLFEDIKQQGILGLCEAATRYDPDRGVKFISYAVFWIRQSVNRWLTYHYTTVRPPSTSDSKYHVTMVPEEHTVFVSSEPSPDLDARRGIDGRYLDYLMSDLSDKDRDVLTLRWSEGWTMTDIGEVYGVTREAIRLRHNRAMVKVRRKALA